MSQRANRKAAKRIGGEWRCHYCHAYFGKKRRHRGSVNTLDHVIPRALGGPDDKWNRVLSCQPCNLAKGAQTYEEFTGTSKLPAQCHSWFETTAEFVAWSIERASR